MKFLPFGLALLTLASSSAVPNPDLVSYDGWKVFRVKTGHAVDDVLNKLSTLSFDQWSHDVDEHVDIALGPDQLRAFENLDLDSECMHEDLGASIATESAGQPSVWKRQVDLSWFNSYHPYADHQTWLQQLQARFPGQSEIISSGRSYQGRDLYGIHLWGNTKNTKPAVLWHGTVHAREWISAMVVEYLTFQLLNTYSSDAVTASILNKYDFYIFPFVNPDGFVYSQTTQRLWRKNRQPPPTGSTCYGRDINRNWPYQWNSNPAGASTNPCDDTFRGLAAGDSPENQGFVQYTNKLRDQNGIKLYIDWHSYGQYILSPLGYNCTLLPADNSEHISLASATSQTIRNQGGYGTRFTFGPSCSTLYATTGSSVDYIYAVGRADWAYTIELRDRGNNGFVLPANQIRPSGEEQWQGMRTMLTML